MHVHVSASISFEELRSLKNNRLYLNLIFKITMWNLKKKNQTFFWTKYQCTQVLLTIFFFLSIIRLMVLFENQ